jgi:hypothetical protein
MSWRRSAATYLDDLCRDLIASVEREDGRAVVLKTDIESVLLPTDRAIPIGLRQTLYRFVGPKGELRADGSKLLKRKGQNVSS